MLSLTQEVMKEQTVEGYWGLGVMDRGGSGAVDGFWICMQTLWIPTYRGQVRRQEEEEEEAIAEEPLPGAMGRLK
eukprot:1537013-Amphidinium_carterae.1